MKIDRLKNYSADTANLGHQSKKNVERAVLHSSAPDSVAFSGKFVDKFFPLTMDEATKELLKYFPKGERVAYEWMNRLGAWAKGEAAGIGITAIGTGLVAPWPIAYNPIVNHKLKKENATPEEIEEKHNTQKYSAWRQPISAVLAIIFQLGVLKPIEKALQHATNKQNNRFNGTVYNQAFLNDKSYMESNVKDALKTKDKATIATNTTQKLNEQIEEFAKTLKGIKKGDAQIKIGNNIVPTEALAEALNNQIEKYIEFAKTLKFDDEKISKYVARSQDLIDNVHTIRQILNSENLEENIKRIMGENPKLSRPEAIRKYISDTKQLYVNKNAGVVGILDHILNKGNSVIESSCASNLERINKVKKACGGEFDMTTYYKFLTKSNQKIDGRIAKLQELLIPESEWGSIKPAELKAKIVKIIEICHYDKKKSVLHNLFKDKGVFLSNKKVLRNKVYDDLIRKGYKEVVQNKYKLFSQITKASVATFIMLPITCTALNWVYPRFMDIFLPNLSGKKNGGAK